MLTKLRNYNKDMHYFPLIPLYSICTMKLHGIHRMNKKKTTRKTKNNTWLFVGKMRIILILFLSYFLKDSNS